MCSVHRHICTEVQQIVPGDTYTILKYSIYFYNEFYKSKRIFSYVLTGSNTSCRDEEMDVKKEKPMRECVCVLNSFFRHVVY